MIEPDHVYGRMVALFASMFVSIVAGTPYLYGVYAPQLVQRVGLSTSDNATISLAVNMGSGLGGLPAGLFIDRFGPQKSVLLGSACIFVGYFALNRIYVYQVASLPLVCVAMAFVGFGSVNSFFAGLKAAQANFPHHRGSAGALPVGAYGLAATLFSLIAARFFDDDAGGLLAFLAFFCGSVAFVGSWFIHIYDPAMFDEEAVLAEPGENSAKPMKRSLSLRGSFSFWGLGSRSLSISLLNEPSKQDREQLLTDSRGQTRMKTQASMSSMNANAPFSNTERSSQEEAIAPDDSSTRLLTPPPPTNRHPAPETAWETIKYLLTNKTYLTHLLIVALCSGLGQMYIYTVGFIVTAQYNLENDGGSAASLQAVQVFTISIASFSGRVVAGVLSDYLYKRLRAQRQWVVLGTIFLIGGGHALLIVSNSLDTITGISLMIGGGYGLLNGTYPAIYADNFGVKVFTTAWGLSCAGPLMVLFLLEKYFGYLYDGQSVDGVCLKGNECYKGAFQVSVTLCLFTLLLTLALMYKKRRGSKAP